MKTVIQRFLSSLLHRIQEHEVSAVGAQMSYYFILSFFPFLIFLLTILGYTSVTSEQILRDLSPILATNGYELVRDFVTETLETRSRTLLSFGMIGTLWAASSGVASLFGGLNKAYEVTERRPYWKVRLISLLFTLVLGFVILLSLTLLIFGKGVGEQLFRFLQYPDQFEVVWPFVRFGVFLSTIFFIFASMYQIIPNRPLSVREVIPGALFSTAGWITTSILFAFYVNNWGSYAKMYGSIGGIIVLLVWLYISSAVILLGGEINATLFFMRDGHYKSDSKGSGPRSFYR
jgi:membrane protein